MLRPFCTLVAVLDCSPCRPRERRRPTPDWPFDILKLKNGVVHKGLLLKEGPAGIRFKIIGRAPGRPTVWLTLAFAKAEVAKLEKLSDANRADPQGEAGGD